MKLPALYFGDSSRLGRPFAKDPAVVRFGGRCLMYYSIPPFDLSVAPPNSAPGWGIGIAESRDLRHWRKIGEVLPEQACEMKGICAPGARVLNGKVHLFYQTYGNGPKDAICHAVSTDGVRFLRTPSNPIFAPTAGVGVWNNGRAIDADVIAWKDWLLLFFSTRDPSGKIQKGGVAAAPLGSDYSRAVWKQISVSSPILTPELPWERACIEASATLTHEGRLYMFYAGGYNNEPQQIGCAVSEDDGAGLRWRRVSDQPLLPNGKPGTWNESESGHPFAFQDDDGRDYLFFQGNNDKGHTWYLSYARILWTPTGPNLVVD